MTNEEINSKVKLLASLLGKCSLEDCGNIPWTWALREECAPFIYYRFTDSIPSEYRKAFSDEYTKGQIQDMFLDNAYTEIDNTLNAHAISHCPIKGCYMAKHAYPDGALRRRGDIDLLLRNEDESFEAWKLMQEKGWTCKEVPQRTQHLPELFKGKLCLEIHNLLPAFFDADKIASFWDKDFIRNGDSYEYNMPDELHFAVALKHCGVHQWKQSIRTLLDCAMLSSKKSFSKEKCIFFCRTIEVGNPDIIFASFPELFDSGDVTDENAFAFRNAFLDSTQTARGTVFAFGEHDRFSLKWLHRHLAIKFSKNVKDNMVKQSGIGKYTLFWTLFSAKCARIFRFLTMSRKDKDMYTKQMDRNGKLIELLDIHTNYK